MSASGKCPRPFKRRPEGALPPMLVDEVKGNFPGVVARNLPVHFPLQVGFRGRRTLKREAVTRRGQMTARVSDFGSLCQEQSILDIDTQIAPCILDLGVPKKDLYGARGTGGL